MRFTEATGLQVVSTSTADTVGKVEGFVVDPATRSVRALRLKKTSGGSLLRWSDLTAFGTDAVTVTDAGRVTDPTDDLAALSGKDRQLLGKRVLSSSGDELGKVKDVEFDAATGTITGLILDDLEVSGVRLLGVGSYAVVVEAG